MSNKGKPYGIRPPAWWKPCLEVVKRGGRPGFRGVGRRLGLEVWGWLAGECDWLWRDQFRESMTELRPRRRTRETMCNLAIRFPWTRAVPDRKRALFVCGLLESALPLMPAPPVQPEPKPLTPEEVEYQEMVDEYTRERRREERFMTRNERRSARYRVGRC